MSDIASNIKLFKQNIPTSVRVVAVSKTKSAKEIFEAYDTGHRLFGENRVQELLSKKDLLPADIEWHFVGHLQSNKARYIIPIVSMIHSVDSFRLLRIIDNEAVRCDKIVDCLLQFFIASEETKYGFSMEEVRQMILTEEYKHIKHVNICGIMGMASFTEDMEQVRSEFRQLKIYFNELKNGYFSDHPSFKEISMGMSGDFRIALEEGSTILRIGSAIFGERS